MEHICFEQDTEKTEFTRVTIVNCRDIAPILFWGNLDLFSFIKQLDSCSAELFLALPKELLVNGRRGISLPGKWAGSNTPWQLPRSLISYPTCILVKAEVITTAFEQGEERIWVIHIPCDGLNNFHHSLWFPCGLVLVLSRIICRELYTYCSFITFCQCCCCYQKIPVKLKVSWCLF